MYCMEVNPSIPVNCWQEFSFGYSVIPWSVLLQTIFFKILLIERFCNQIFNLAKSDKRRFGPHAVGTISFILSID